MRPSPDQRIQSGATAAHSKTRRGTLWSAPHEAALWTAAVAVFVANLFLHKPISDISDWLLARLGFATFSRGTLLAIGGGSALAAAALAVRMPRQWWSPRLIAALALLLVLSAGTQRWLLVSNVELIHFPQYALLAALLLLGGAGWQTAWLLAGLAGMLDEVYQYVVVYAGRPEAYLDFNDMVLNAIGATWGVLLLPVSENGERTLDNGRKATGLLAIAAAISITWWDPPQLTPFFQLAATGRLYRVLSAGEAALVIAPLWWTLGYVLRPVRRGRRWSEAESSRQRMQRTERTG